MTNYGIKLKHIRSDNGTEFKNTGLDDYLDEHREETIDKLLEELMERYYMQVDDISKRMYRCFFERYQDGSYEKTKERVKRLEMQSNNK